MTNEKMIELAASSLDSYNSYDYPWGVRWSTLMRENGEFIMEENGLYCFKVSYGEDVYNINFRMDDNELIPVAIMEEE